MTELAQATGTVIGTVQTDTFCNACGYNLHAQPVIREERLQIPICRCPECGHYAAAGQTLTATRVWLNRLATMLLTSWVFSLLLFFALCALFEGLLAYGHMMEMTEMYQVSAPTTQALASGAIYMAPYRYAYRIKNTADPDEQIKDRWAQFWLATIATLLALINGIVYSALLWHCKGWLRLPAFLPPLVGCLVFSVVFGSDPSGRWIRHWGLTQISYYFVLELACVAIGLQIGRPIARTLANILLPPKARQHFAFLWIADGKRSPA